MATQKTLPQQLQNMDRPRLAAYKDNLAFYNGNQWPAARRQTSTKRLTFNMAHAIVDKTTAYVLQGLEPGMAPLSDSDTDVARAQLAEDALNQISEANHLPRLDYDAEIDCAVLGDGVFKLAWDAQVRQVVITAPDVQGVFAWPNPHDLTIFDRIAHRYQLPAEDVFNLWAIRPKRDPATIVEDWTLQSLQIWVDDQTPAIITNPYGFIPFILYPNQPLPKQWNGISDITQIKTVCEELNASLSRLSSILEVSGNPIAVLEGVEQSRDIEVSPGAVWEIPPAAKAYLLDLLQGGGVRLHIDYFDTLIRTLHDLAETPRAAFGGVDRDLSGVALHVELQPLLHKVARKRLIRTQALSQRTDYSLRILDLNTDTQHATAGIPTIAWDPPTPHDRSRHVTDEAQLVTARLTSRRTAIARLGDPDPDAEWERCKEEEQALDNIHRRA